MKKYGSLVLLICLFLIFSLWAFGEDGTSDQEYNFSGYWSNNLYLNFANTQNDGFDYNSTFLFNYEGKDFNLSGKSVLTDTKAVSGDFYRQSFNTEFSLGVFDLGSELMFYPYNKEMEYWLNEVTLPFAGMTFKDTFLLERIQTGTFGAGMDITVSGNIAEGVNLKVSTLLGMERNEAERMGIVDGSGYDITQTEAYAPSKFQYVETVIEVGTMTLGCLEYENKTVFSEEEGFEYTLFEFLMEEENMPVSLEADLKFTPQTKSLELDPQIDLGWACIDVYSDLAHTGEKLEGLEIEGFGITGVELGPITLSSLTALKDTLYHDLDKSDINLRAYDYFVDPEEPAYYYMTAYDQVFSVETRPEGAFLDSLYLGTDFYFDMSGSPEIFDLSKFTAEARYGVTDYLEFNTGLSYDLEDIEKSNFMLGFNLVF